MYTSIYTKTHQEYNQLEIQSNFINTTNASNQTIYNDNTKHIIWIDCNRV